MRYRWKDGHLYSIDTDGEEHLVELEPSKGPRPPSTTPNQYPTDWVNDHGHERGYYDQRSKPLHYYRGGR